MLFQDLHQESRPEEQARTVYIYENGMSDQKPIPLKLIKKKTSIREISKLFKNAHIRIYNSEGSEYFEEDLDYIKNGSVLYVSKGEEFDPTSCFAQYELLKLLGEGGFGKVYLAEHKQTKEKFAIKIIKTENIGSVSDIDAIFVQAEILKSLRHQNIVQVYKCLTMKNMEVIIIMEFLEGGDLFKYVSGVKHLNEPTAKVMIRQVVRGILYCHQNNLTHRDLKLQNLLLVNSEEKKIKIIDFGIAGVISSMKLQQLDTGSLSYMAPECFAIQKNYRFDGRIDVWSIGVILYAMLFGHLPFKGASTTQTIALIKEGAYKIPAIKEKRLSHHCLTFLKSCLDPNPKTRISIEDLNNHRWLEDNIFGSEEKLEQMPQIHEDEVEDEDEGAVPKLKDIANKPSHSHSNSRKNTARSTKSNPKESPRSSLSKRTGAVAKTEYPKSKFK